MKGSIIPYQTLAFLDLRRGDFEDMSRNGHTPGLDCIISFLIEVERRAFEEVPNRAENIARVCNKWTSIGIGAARGVATEINWGSPCIMGQLFRDFRDALDVE